MLNHWAMQHLYQETIIFLWRNWNWAELWSSWAWKPLCVPHTLFLRNRLHPPWPSLSSKGKIQTVANQGKEGMQQQGRSSQEIIVQSWGRALVLPQGYTNNIFELFTELNRPQMESVSSLCYRKDCLRLD